MEDHKREQPLQAVVLADSFSEQFRPVTLQRPKVLLPLADVPMLSYSLELLARNSVREVFIFCTAHSKRVQEFVEASGWGKRFDSVQCICSSACTSVGEALRWLDDNYKGAVASDPFVLIHGDTVSNLDLGPHIVAHKQRRKQRAENTLTMFLQRAGRASIRPVEDDLVVGLDDQTKQVVFFSDDREASLLNIPRKILEQHEQFSLHTDLVDAQVYLCSPEVLWRFNECFDYADLRRDFVTLEVADLELGQVCFAEQLRAGEYAARAHDPRVYHGVCQDILHRWAFPIVPESTMFSGGDGGDGAMGSGSEHPAALVTSALERKTRYRRSQATVGNRSMVGHASIVYRDMLGQRPVVARTASLSGAVLLGGGTVVGERCSIDSSTLGPRCSLGDDVQLQRCHLWTNVSVEAGAQVDSSILCDGVVVKAGAKVSRGCVLSFGVVVGAGVELPPFTRLTLSAAEEDDGFGEEDEEEEELGALEGEAEGSSDGESRGLDGEEWDEALVGTDGKGRAWAGPQDEDEEETAVLLAAAAAAAGEVWTGKDLDPWQGGSLGAVEHERAASRRHLAGRLLAEDEEEEEEEEEEDAGGEGRGGGDGVEFGADAILDHGSGPAGGAAAAGSAVDGSSASAAGQASFIDAISEMVQQSDASDASSVQALITEVKCYKLAQNRSFDDCLTGVVAALFRLSACEPSAQGSKATAQLAGGIKAHMLRLKDLVLALLPTTKDEVALIHHLEAAGLPLLHFELGLTLKVLYDEPLEVLTEDAILEWAAGKRAAVETSGAGREEHRLFEQTKTKQFLTWLEEEEEESDEEESEEEA